MKRDQLTNNIYWPWADNYFIIKLKRVLLEYFENKGFIGQVWNKKMIKLHNFRDYLASDSLSHIHCILTHLLTNKCVFDGNVQVLFVQPVPSSRVYINCVHTSIFKALASQSSDLAHYRYSPHGGQAEVSFYNVWRFLLLFYCEKNFFFFFQPLTLDVYWWNFSY